MEKKFLITNLGKGKYGTAVNKPVTNGNVEELGGGESLETDPTVPSYVKTITQEEITKWNNSTNNYVKEGVFNLDNGFLYLHREGLPSVSFGLNGRYSLLDHSHNLQEVTDTGSITTNGVTTGGLVSNGNIEMKSGWMITSAGTRVGIGGLPNLSSNPLQVHGGFDLNNGNITFMNSGVTNNVLYTGGAETFILRNFGTEPSTLFEVRSKAGNPGSDIREATIALTRTDDNGNAEFFDIYNNGYHTGAPASVQHGMRVQSRGTGLIRPFIFDWYDGTTYTDGYKAEITTGFTFYKDVTATKLVNSNSSDSYVLLGGGGTQLLSNLTNVQPDWNAVSGDALILNKPTLATTNWNTAYDKRVASISFTGTTTKTARITFADSTFVEGTFTDIVGEAGTADGNNYLTGVTGSANGTMTFARTGLANIAFTSTHTHTWAQITGAPTYDNYVSWNLRTNGIQRTTIGSGGILDLVGGSNVSLSYGAGGVVNISSTDTNTDTNNYLTGVTGSANGMMTFARLGLSNVTFDAAHTHNYESPLTFAATGSATVSRSGNTITIGATAGTGADGNNYLTGVTGSANGTMTFTRTGLANLSFTSTHAHAWADITSKPTTFTPSSHTHLWSEITGAPASDNYQYWRLGANASYTSITPTASVNFVGSGATSVGRSGNTITITSTDTNTDTNTWRPIDDAPVNGVTTESISSNWAFNHTASSTAHPRDTRSQISGTYLGAISYNQNFLSTHQVLWGNGNNVYGTAGVYINPSTNVLYAADFAGTSDVRQKENILVVKPRKINTEYKTFNFIGNEQPRFGVIAQELEIEHPEFVRTNEDGIKSVSYSDLHSAEIAYLKDKIEKLEALVNKLIN